MKITLSIVIPYYKETPRRIFPLLASLNGQVGVNFAEIECILVDGGAQNVLPESFLACFENLTPRVLHMAADEGPGVSRQTGLDAAAGDYVMFCDADDMLYSVEVLRHFLHAIKSQDTRDSGLCADMFWSPWYEECRDAATGKYSYFLHELNETWLHGRAFRRNFLKNKNVRFHEKLRSHEDAYFMALVEAEARTMIRIGEISYIWKYNPESVTRRDNNAAYAQTMLLHVESLGYALEAVAARGSMRIAHLAVDAIMYYYFALHEKLWQLPENYAHLHATEAAFGAMIKNHFHYFENAPQDFLADLYSRQRASYASHSPETETLYEWLGRLGLRA